MILADLPYAHETLGKYGKATFFNPYDSMDLANCMRNAITGKVIYVQHEEIIPTNPYVSSWKELLELILNESENSETKCTCV